MPKSPPSRRAIRLLARHSDWGSGGVGRALHRHHRPGAAAWRYLLRLLLVGLGVGLTAAGVWFFFAYNWEALPKFGKIGLATAGVAIPAVLALLPRWSPLVRDILVTAAAFLVGPLYGVIGQVYQTGANAYDLFVAWALFIVVWVVVADFAPLWLLWLGLVNVSFVLYDEQVAVGWTDYHLFGGLVAINTLAAVVFHALHHTGLRRYPYWWLSLTVLATAFSSGLLAVHAIFRPPFPFLPVVLAMAGLMLAVAYFAFRQRRLAYLAVAALWFIGVTAAFIISGDAEEVNLLLATLWASGATTLSIVFLNTLRKRWTDDDE